MNRYNYERPFNSYGRMFESEGMDPFEKALIDSMDEDEEMDEDMDEDLNEDQLFESDDDDYEEELMSDEDLKIESLKIATNIAKLMQDVLPDDIIRIAESVCKFVRHHQIGQPYNPDAMDGEEEGDADSEDFGADKNVVSDESQIEFDDDDMTSPTNK